MNRTSPTDLRNRLAEAGAWSQKSYGQHFLIDEGVLAAIVEAAGVQKGDKVLEIGPGPGVLTEVLLEKGAELTVFEADPAMVELIKADFKGINLVAGDALHTIPLQPLETGYKVVANIPYQITTPLLRLFLEGELATPESLTLLVQKEVAERLAAPAKTGDRGYLSVLTQYYAGVSVVCNVPPSSFWPSPSVNSAVIHLVVKAERALPKDQEALFFKYVKARFIEPRKQFKNVLAGIRGETTAAVVTLLTSLGLPENVRAQELTQAQWIELFNAHV